MVIDIKRFEHLDRTQDGIFQRLQIYQYYLTLFYLDNFQQYISHSFNISSKICLLFFILSYL
jgi:hypothetical protein